VPDYLLKSSLLTTKDDRLTHKSSTTPCHKKAVECNGSTRTAALCKSRTVDESGVKLAKMENHLLKSQLPSSLIENRLLAQWSAQCLKSSVGLISATKDELDSTHATPVLSSVPIRIKNPLPESKFFATEHVIKRRVLDLGGTSVAIKTEPKLEKKVKLAVPEKAEDVSRFELPNYQLPHERVESEKVELFVSPDKELMVEQLMRHVIDVPSIKVDM